MKAFHSLARNGSDIVEIERVGRLDSQMDSRTEVQLPDDRKSHSADGQLGSLDSSMGPIDSSDSAF